MRLSPLAHAVVLAAMLIAVPKAEATLYQINSNDVDRIGQEVRKLQNTINGMQNEMLQNRMYQMERDMNRSTLDAAASMAAYDQSLVDLYQEAAANCPAHSDAPDLHEVLKDILIQEQDLRDIMTCANLICTSEIKKRLSPEIVNEFERMSYLDKQTAFSIAFDSSLKLRDVRNERIKEYLGICTCDDGWEADSGKTSCVRVGGSATNQSAAAQKTVLPPDVGSDAWYHSALSSFVDAGFIPAEQSFRPSDMATRGEFIRLIVELNGGILQEPPAQPSFDDVPADSAAFGWFEEAAKEGWVTGQGDCYGKHPCNAKPNDPINRAEAAALIIRTFGLVQGDAPTFDDAPAGAWYADIIRTAASKCILQGDANARTVRPAGSMNRAEMAVMLWRVDRDLTYPDCQH